MGYDRNSTDASGAYYYCDGEQHLPPFGAGSWPAFQESFNPPLL
jgi:hypothetical protein